jgi:hypothetical protein
VAKRGRQSAEKRRIDKLRQDQQAAKRERRHSRESGESGESDGVSPDELMERFRILSEGHAAGRISDEEFGPARHELMVALGVEEPEPEASEEG